MNTEEKEDYKEKRETLGMFVLNGLASTLINIPNGQQRKTLVETALDLTEDYLKEVNVRNNILDKQFPEEEE